MNLYIFGGIARSFNERDEFVDITAFFLLSNVICSRHLSVALWDNVTKLPWWLGTCHVGLSHQILRARGTT